MRAQRFKFTTLRNNQTGGGSNVPVEHVNLESPPFHFLPGRVLNPLVPLSQPVTNALEFHILSNTPLCCKNKNKTRTRSPRAGIETLVQLSSKGWNYNQPRTGRVTQWYTHDLDTVGIDSHPEIRSSHKRPTTHTHTHHTNKQTYLAEFGPGQAPAAPIPIPH